MADDVSSRILAAATLADKAAAAFGIGIRVDLTAPGATIEDAEAVAATRSRISAAGPSHWGAVAELLRTTVQQHRPEMHTKYNVPCFDEFDSPTVVYRRCAGCHTRFFPGSAQSEASGCPSLAALLPFADQIIRDLGDGQ